MDTSDFLSQLLDGDGGSYEEVTDIPGLDQTQSPRKKTVRQEIEVYLEWKRLMECLRDPVNGNEKIEKEELYGD